MKLLQQLTDYLFWQDMLSPEELSALSALGICIPNRWAGYDETILEILKEDRQLWKDILAEQDTDPDVQVGVWLDAERRRVLQPKTGGKKKTGVRRIGLAEYSRALETKLQEWEDPGFSAFYSLLGESLSHRDARVMLKQPFRLSSQEELLPTRRLFSQLHGGNRVAQIAQAVFFQLPVQEAPFRRLSPHNREQVGRMIFRGENVPAGKSFAGLQLAQNIVFLQNYVFQQWAGFHPLLSRLPDEEGFAYRYFMQENRAALMAFVAWENLHDTHPRAAQQYQYAAAAADKQLGLRFVMQHFPHEWMEYLRKSGITGWHDDILATMRPPEWLKRYPKVFYSNRPLRQWDDAGLRPRLAGFRPVLPDTAPSAGRFRVFKPARSYDLIRPMREGQSAVCKEGAWGLVDCSGREVIECRLRAEKDVSAFISDKTPGRGQMEKWTSCFATIKPFCEGRAAVFGWYYAWGFIDEAGELLVPCQYRYAFSFSEGFAAVWKSNGEWWFIDHSGQERFGPFASAFQFREGLAAVQCPDGDYAYLDTDGKLHFKQAHKLINFLHGYGLVIERHVSQRGEVRFFEAYIDRNFKYKMFSCRRFHYRDREGLLIDDYLVTGNTVFIPARISRIQGIHTEYVALELGYLPMLNGARIRQGLEKLEKPEFPLTYPDEQSYKLREFWPETCVSEGFIIGGNNNAPGNQMGLYALLPEPSAYDLPVNCWFDATAQTLWVQNARTTEIALLEGIDQCLPFDETGVLVRFNRENVFGESDCQALIDVDKSFIFPDTETSSF